MMRSRASRGRRAPLIRQGGRLDGWGALDGGGRIRHTPPNEAKPTGGAGVSVLSEWPRGAGDAVCDGRTG